LSKYGINSHQADFSVGGPPHGFSPLSFTKKYIGAYDDDVYMTMESWVTRQWEYDLGRDLILQMDIEGAEYSSLLATPDRILKRFRIIVLEMHGLQDWAQSSFYEIASSLINKLSQSFIVVHNHPNNHGGMFNINGFEMPGTIEITLLRKDRCKVIEKTEVFPHHLDAPCGPQLPEVVLPDGFR